MTCILIAGFFWLQIGDSSFVKVANIDSIYDTRLKTVINANGDLVESPISATEIMEVLKTCDQIPQPKQ